MNLKTYAIETLEIAQWNVLKAIFRLHLNDFEVQIESNYNPVQWIIGHLTLQMNYYFNILCQKKSLVSDKLRFYYYPPTDDMEEITDFPISIMELIDVFLEVSESAFKYLYNLPVEKFAELPEFNQDNTETISEIIQRVALHFLGHTGQIIWIKKHIGKGGAFVMGVKKKQRDDSKKKWMKWWNDNKKKYSDVDTTLSI